MRKKKKDSRYACSARNSTRKDEMKIPEDSTEYNDEEITCEFYKAAWHENSTDATSDTKLKVHGDNSDSYEEGFCLKRL